MFQIFTEDRNRNKLLKIFSEHLQNYTLLFGDGMWRGVSEPCIVVQFTGVPHAVAEQIAESIRQINSQDSVLLIELQTKVKA